jgi:eukaryotic-like serine/threonine-protein kinase
MPVGETVERGDLIAGRYRLDAEIGSGGMGEAWRAIEQGTNAAVVLNPVRLSHLAPDERERNRGRLRAEAGIASSLDHPNLISVRGVVEHDGEPWLVMEYVPAPNLAELTAAGPLPPRRAAGIGAQVAKAMDYAHLAVPGVVHRPVTPRNLLVGEGDHVKLAGFGISTIEGDDPVGTEPIGTGAPVLAGEAAYVAPEVANGIPGGPNADVFSLGATLYAAVEGRPPWGDGDPGQVLAAARKGVVEPPRAAGPLGPVLMRMLQSRPRERPTAAAAAQMLAEVARGGGRGELAGRRRRWPLIAAAAVAVVVVAGAGLVVWPRPAADVPAAAPGPALGDPATADPCSLIRPEPLDRFGQTTLETDSGNFDRCDVVIDSGQDRFAAQVQLDQAGTVLPPGVPEERDGLTIVRGAPAPGECVRTLRLSDGHDVRVIARLVRGAPPDLCAVADVVTDTALGVLVGGPVPRRPAPFDPGSLALVDACGLLDAATIATVPGLETAEPDPGFGGWYCDWELLNIPASVVVTYDRNRGGLGRDAGNRIRIAGRDAAARADQDGAGCDVTVLHRPYTDRRGYPSGEMLSVKVDQAARVRDPCVLGIAIATVAVERLPAAP